jgi:hypothetical protein
MMISGTGRVPAAAAVCARQHHDTPTPAIGTALVPVIPAIERAPISRSIPRPDAFFVAQLIAMAQHSPQTRVLRRATPEDARATYHSTTVQNENVAQAAPRVLRIA